MELDFNKIFIIPTTALRLARAHPYIPRDKKWILQFVTVHSLFTLTFLLILYNIFCHDLKANNFTQTCQNGVLFVVYIVISYQYGVLLTYQNTLVGLIADMNKDFQTSKDLPPKERDSIKKYINQGLWVCKQWLFLTISGCAIFLFKNLGLMLYYYCMNEFRLVPFYEVVLYPPIMEENRDNIFVYLLMYAIMLLFSAYSALMYAAFVPLGPIFILHACGQLVLVKLRIDDLFVECDDEVIRKKLKGIILHLQYVHSFVDRIQQVFKIGYELTLKFTALILPITIYAVLEGFYRGEVNVEFVTFIVGGVMISGSPCYYSDLLMEKGEDVRMSLYTCGWEQHYDRRTRTTLQLMLQNALKPIAIQTVFTVMCLDALTDLFQQSYAIFNLMNCMWN
ncbi:uncharacterized protein LOC110375040 [Helicoverpa armigera]|uniref:Odorant receptor n=1 Tax=Helicoverpa armigera TaxID=29058 RepID=A0A7T3KAT7_HELAM|nr:odorant receptor [Helicoverpa armigera]